MALFFVAAVSASSPLGSLNESSSRAVGPFSAYADAHSSLPVLLLCYDRPKHLERAINSLLNVRGVSKDNILVSQDGNVDSVTKVIKRWGLAHVRHPRVPSPTKSMDTFIALHYKFAVQAAR